MAVAILIASGLGLVLGWTYRNTLAMILGLVGLIVALGVAMP
jgi:hypothetical protein